MPKPLGPPLSEFLYAALASPLGVIIEEPSGRADRLKQRLYAERKSDPALRAVSITEHPLNPTTHLILLNKGDPDAQKSAE